MNIQDVRRARLAQLISDNYGNQANFIEQTNENQGEVSALLKSKSFGEKKARSLELKCGLPMYWLDGELAPVGFSTQAQEVAKAFDRLSPEQRIAVMGVIRSYGVPVEEVPSEKKVVIKQSAPSERQSRVEAGTKKQSSQSS